MNNATKIRVSRLKSGYEIYIMDGNVAYKNFFITSWEVPTFVKEIGNTFKRNISISDVILAFTNAKKEDAYFEVYKSPDIVSNTINSILEHSIYENKEIVEIQKEVKIGKIVLEKGDKIKILTESNKITKTKFHKLYSSGELSLVQGGIPKKAEEIFSLLKSKGSDWINNEIKTRPVSRIDTGSQLGSGMKITIFEENIYGRYFYIVEDEIDNSLNNDVSWNTLEYFSTVYTKI